ncbi:MAG: hypothetical protein RIA65_12375, partial [Woeseia sp.]
AIANELVHGCLCNRPVVSHSCGKKQTVTDETLFSNTCQVQVAHQPADRAHTGHECSKPETLAGYLTFPS